MKRWLAAGLGLLCSLDCREKQPDTVECELNAPKCVQPLPEQDPEGKPWPSYSEAKAEVSPESCGADAFFTNFGLGTCTNGRTYVTRGTGYVGDSRYFDGERLVGASYSSDEVSCGTCTPAVGDTSCPGPTDQRWWCGANDAGPTLVPF